MYFFVVVPVNALIVRSDKEPPADPTTRKCGEYLSEIPIGARCVNQFNSARSTYFGSRIVSSALSSDIRLPFLFHHPGHFLSNFPKPVPISCAKVVQHTSHSSGRSQVYVCDFLTHRVQQLIFVAHLRQTIYLNRVGIRRETPYHPPPLYFLKGIMRSHR